VRPRSRYTDRGRGDRRVVQGVERAARRSYCAGHCARALPGLVDDAEEQVTPFVVEPHSENEVAVRKAPRRSYSDPEAAVFPNSGKSGSRSWSCGLLVGEAQALRAPTVVLAKSAASLVDGWNDCRGI